MERTISCVWSKRPEEHNRLVSQSACFVPEYWCTKRHLCDAVLLWRTAVLSPLCACSWITNKSDWPGSVVFWTHTNSVPVFCVFFVAYYVPGMSREMQNTPQWVPLLALSSLLITQGRWKSCHPVWTPLIRIWGGMGKASLVSQCYKWSGSWNKCTYTAYSKTMQLSIHWKLG